jgi:uncharacterized oligopeptide transporter (OPT) family protein
MLKKDYLLLVSGFILGNAINSSILLINIPKWREYGWESVAMNILIVIVIMAFSSGLLIWAFRMIKGIEDKAEKERLKNDAKRDVKRERDLVKAIESAFTTALEANNIKLAQVIKDTLGK